MLGRAVQVIVEFSFINILAKMDIKLVNVLLLGFGFMLVFTAFQTCVNIQVSLLNCMCSVDLRKFTGCCI